MVHGPGAGLELLKSLDADSRLAEHDRLDAVRGHLFEMAGDDDTAVAHFRAAARNTRNLSERDYLLTTAAAVAARSTRDPKLEPATRCSEHIKAPRV